MGDGRRFFKLGSGLQGRCTRCILPKPADAFRTCAECREKKRLAKAKLLRRYGTPPEDRMPLIVMPGPDLSHLQRRDYTPRPAPVVEYDGQQFWVVYNGTVS